MNPDRVPPWLVALIVFFGLATAAGVITFQYFYAESTALITERRQTKVEVADARQAKDEFGQDVDPLNRLLLSRREEISRLERRNQEAAEIIGNSLEPRLREGLTQLKVDISSLQQTEDDLTGQAERAMADLKQEEDQYTSRQRENESALRKYREEVDELKQEIKRRKKAYREELAGIDANIREREKRVQELLNRIDIDADELISDGILLQARVSDGFVFINRGLNHDLRQRTRFVVFNRRAGENYIKGEIEVVKVYTGMSEARVIEEVDANDPIVAGDHIHNNIYNPHEQKVFVIKGDFDLYSREELRRFVEDAGGRVDKQISSQTHYLVAGSNADAALEQASLIGVTIMSERQLLDFVRRQDTYQFTQGMHFVLAGEFTEIDRGRVREFVDINGGVIQGAVDKDTDVVIAGENAVEAVTKARAMGAIIMNQQQFVHMMGQGEVE
ncbi:MAG: BRCT domain-containing protein [Planctomycetota bacterium]